MLSDKQRVARELASRALRNAMRVGQLRRAAERRANVDVMVMFWDCVDRSPGHGPSGDCWLWREDKLTAGGYGYFCALGRQFYAHRFAWARTNATPIPKDREICHRCNVARCVNPDHLYLGTREDNLRDARESRAGRAPVWPAERVATLRGTLGDDLETFANRIGVVAATVAGWEAGRREPRGVVCRLMEKLENGDATSKRMDAGAPDGAA